MASSIASWWWCVPFDRDDDVDAEVVDGDEDDVPRQSVGGSYGRARATGPTAAQLGCRPTEPGERRRPHRRQRQLPNVIVSNTTGETTYTNASALLAK